MEETLSNRVILLQGLLVYFDSITFPPRKKLKRNSLGMFGFVPILACVSFPYTLCGISEEFPFITGYQYYFQRHFCCFNIYLKEGTVKPEKKLLRF